MMPAPAPSRTRAWHFGEARWTSASNPFWPTFSRSRAKTRTRIRDGARVALADCEAIFRAQEVNKRMKDKAAHACHALCRARVVEEIQRHKERESQRFYRMIDGAGAISLAATRVGSPVEPASKHKVAQQQSCAGPRTRAVSWPRFKNGEPLRHSNRAFGAVAIGALAIAD